MERHEGPSDGSSRRRDGVTGEESGTFFGGRLYLAEGHDDLERGGVGRQRSRPAGPLMVTNEIPSRPLSRE